MEEKKKKLSAREDMDPNRQHEDGEDDEEEDRVDKNGLAVGFEASEFDPAGISGKLEEEARREQYEEQPP